MRLGLVAAALLAAASFSSVAQATKFNFGMGADSGDDLTPFFTGGGSFETAGDDGTFTLASGLQDFSMSGIEGVYVIGGYFTLGMADLASFSATLDHGTLTAISFDSASFPVDQWLFGVFNVGVPAANVQFSVSGLVAPGNFSFTTDIGLDSSFGLLFGTSGPITGDFGASPAPAPEHSSWALMLGGFGLVGGAMRIRRRQVSFA